MKCHGPDLAHCIVTHNKTFERTVQNHIKLAVSHHQQMCYTKFPAPAFVWGQADEFSYQTFWCDRALISQTFLLSPFLYAHYIISSLHSPPFHPSLPSPCFLHFLHLCPAIQYPLLLPFLSLHHSISNFPHLLSLDSSFPSTSPILSLLSSSTQCRCKNLVSLKTWCPVTLAHHPTPGKWMDIDNKTASVYVVCVLVSWIPLNAQNK